MVDLLFLKKRQTVWKAAARQLAGVMLFAALSPYSFAQEKDEALLGHWKFDEGEGTTSADASGNGGDAILHNGGWTDGVVGKGVLLNGDGWIEITNPAFFELGQEFTLEIWVKTLGPDGYALFANGGWSRGWQTTIHPKYIGISSIGFEGVGKVYYDQFPAGENRPFRQIVFTCTKPEGSEMSQLCFYVNGKLKERQEVIGGLQKHDNAPLTIGKMVADKVDNLVGIVDEARIFNRALDVGEIRTRYEEIDNQGY